jgi:hypothetical protein
MPINPAPLILVTSDGLPSRAIDSNYSYFVACFNPVVFRFVRTDFVFDSVSAGGAGESILNNTNVSTDPFDPSGLVAGDLIYIRSLAGYNGFYSVISTTTSTVTIASPFLGSTFGSVTSEKSNVNLHVDIKIVKVDPVSSVETLVSNAYFYPRSDGTIRADISQYLQPFLKNENNFQYDVVNVRDQEASVMFKIYYRPRYVNFDEESNYRYVAARFVAVNAAKQLLDTYNGNMGEHVVIITPPTADPVKRGKFLSGFKKPTYWPGFPFDLSFGYAEPVTPTELKKVEERFDLSGNSGGGVNETQLDDTQSGGVNRMLLDETYILPDTGFINVWLEDGAAAHHRYIAPGYVDDNYVSP